MKMPRDGDVIEALAEALAEIDGFKDEFSACKDSPSEEATVGYYEEYLRKAENAMFLLEKIGFTVARVTA